METMINDVTTNETTVTTAQSEAIAKREAKRLEAEKLAEAKKKLAEAKKIVLADFEDEKKRIIASLSKVKQLTFDKDAKKLQVKKINQLTKEFTREDKKLSKVHSLFFGQNDGQKIIEEICKFDFIDITKVQACYKFSGFRGLFTEETEKKFLKRKELLETDENENGTTEKYIYTDKITYSYANIRNMLLVICRKDK